MISCTWRDTRVKLCNENVYPHIMYNPLKYFLDDGSSRAKICQRKYNIKQGAHI
jgi:hypothetical protein